jgi:hypothetical protein
MLFVEAITMIFTGMTITFLKQLCFGLWLTLPLLLSLAAGITLLGYGVGRKEGWSRLDTFYWSFIRQPQSVTAISGRSKTPRKLLPFDGFPGTNAVGYCRCGSLFTL